MTRQVRQAALKILLLLAEHSAEELAEAVALVGGEKDEDLLAFLARASVAPKKGLTRASKPGLDPAGETWPLRELKRTDEEKYRLLKEFESRVRNGEILRTLDDFRAFGRVLGKDYSPGKSRKEALTRLMAALAQMDIASVQTAIARVPVTTANDEGAFHRLADEIISGGRRRSSVG